MSPRAMPHMRHENVVARVKMDYETLMTTATSTLEVFQDLILREPADGGSVLRQALLSGVVTPWHHAGDDEKELLSRVSDGSDILVFQRDASDGLAAARLVLWSRPGGYEVANIVPSGEDALDYGQYNALLQDFAWRIATPAARETGCVLETTAARQSLEAWLTPQSADALRRFSGHANKAMGSTHSLDRKRWFRFLLQVHADARRIDTGQLARWLTEIEGWSDEKALELAVEYEFALALLNEYDLRPN